MKYYSKKDLEQMSDEDLLSLQREVDNEVGRLDTLQLSLKIFINSIYGTFANNHSPFYDIDAAASITLTGQACVKESSIIIEKFARESGIEEDLTVYGDTDSVYFTISPLLEKRNIKLLNDKDCVDKEALTLTEDIEQYLNDNITEWAGKTLNTNDSRFVFKREAICPSGLFLQKKRYILDVRNDEGFDVNKKKFVGVEVARSSFSEPVKNIIRDIVSAIFKHQDECKVNQAYRDGYEAFKQLQPDDISIRVSINDYEKYSERSDGYSIGKHTPVHVKGAIYYNNLLDQYKIKTNYEGISSGQKVKWFYCNSNKYNISVLSYPDVMPSEISADIQPDYKKMFDKLITSNVSRMFAACKWTIDDLAYDYETRLADFLFEM